MYRKKAIPILAVIASLSALLLWWQWTAAVSASNRPNISHQFTYQGSLEDSGVPADGVYDFQFRLYDALDGGGQVGTAIPLADVPVSAGLFTVILDFGDVWDGTAVYLEIDVRVDSSGEPYHTLTPRQPLTPAPYAIFSGGAPWEGLRDVPAGFADGLDDDALTGLICNSGQIPKWNGAAWICGEDDIGVGGGGDITAVYPGAGLLGGGETGAITLTVAFSGTGSAISAAHSDHLHDDRYYTQSDLQTAGSASVHWDNLSNVPPDLADGDDNTTYTAGIGLGLNGAAFDLETGYQLPQACAGGQIPAWDGAAWGCADDADSNTTYSAGNGLILNGTEFAAQGSPFANVVIVAQSGGDFSSVQAAIDSINDASANNPYLVWIAPGVYNEAVTLKPFIHLQGAGETAVILSSSATSPAFPPITATLLLTANVSVRDLTVVNSGAGSYNTAVLALDGSAGSTLAQVTAQAEGAGTTGYGLYLAGADTDVRGTAVTLNTANHTDVYGVFIDDGASLQLADSTITANTLDNNAFGVYIVDAGSALTATQSTVLALGDNDSYGLYNIFGRAHLRDVSVTGQASGVFGTDSYGIYTFGDLVAYDVTAVGANARFYNYGLESFADTVLYGGLYEGRNGAGTTNVHAAVGIHSRGTLYAEGVTARGTGHTSRNQGLDNEGGATTLVGGYFYGEGGTAAYGIENFGTGGVLTATAVTVIGKNGSSGSYGLYNGGPATLVGGSFTGSGLGGVFGTYGINNVFTIGVLEAHGVTAVGENGTDEVWGLSNWLGSITLDGGSFTASGGVTAYGIDNDTNDASLTATGVTVLAANATATNIGLFNRNTADAVLLGGSFTARGGSVAAHGIYNQGSGSNLTADNVTVIAADSAENNGLRNQNSAISNVTAARLVGTGSHAIYMTSGVVRVGVTEISGGATRSAGALTCFQAYDDLFAAYTCP